MNKRFRSLNSIILINFLIASVISGLIFMMTSEILIDVLAKYVENPKVFKRIADEEFADLQRFATENDLVSTNGKAFTEWNDEHYYVSFLVVRQNEMMCYNSFVSYDMTYTESDDETFYWGSKILPVYTYRLKLSDETCKVYFSGYLDLAYEPLRKGICVLFALASFILVFFLLFKKYTLYISRIEENVKSVCNKDFSKQIDVTGNNELSSLAENINKMNHALYIYFSEEKMRQQESEQFVRSIAHDIRTPLTSVIGYLELMTKQDIDRQQREYFLQRALDKANHINALTNDLFTFEESFEKLQFEEYDGNETLNQIYMSVINYLTANNIKYICTNKVTVKFSINTNITLLLRLADNVCSNITKHACLDSPVKFYSSILDNKLIIRQENRLKEGTENHDSTSSGGFGLKICTKILDSMKGTISHSVEENLFRLEISVPVNIK